MTLRTLASKSSGGADLSRDEAEWAARALAAEGGDHEAKKEFLVSLAAKGESSEEVIAFASVFRELARDPGFGEMSEEAIDVVGTGGDHSGSFNISTTVSFVLAASGITVLKHGNRSITSKSGSADLLTALGIRTDAPLEMLKRSVEELNFCFFFAPAFHPAFKEIMPVRQELAAEGQRTIFNILGPLINPARPGRQLLGVYSESWVEPIARTLDGLGLERGIVVHGRLPDGDGLDELSCAGDNRVAGCGELADLNGIWTPEERGFPRCSAADLAGGSNRENVAILESILEGSGPAGLVDTILLNAAAAFTVCGVSDGVERARHLLLGGAVEDWLRRARGFYGQ